MVSEIAAVGKMMYVLCVQSVFIVPDHYRKCVASHGNSKALIDLLIHKQPFSEGVTSADMTLFSRSIIRSRPLSRSRYTDLQ